MRCACFFSFLEGGEAEDERVQTGIQNVHTIKVSFAWRIISVKDESKSNASSVPHLAITTPAKALHSVKSVCVNIYVYTCT
jgi:hypothetical protein